MYGDEHKTLILTQTAKCIALIAIGGWISIAVPFLPVPLTLQTLFVLLSGAVMKRYAVIPAMLYVVLGVLGLPIFHNGLAGIGVLLGPTGGYILGFIAAAAIVGIAYEQDGRFVKITGLGAGTAAIYGAGVIWLMYSASLTLTEALLMGVAPFIIGDALKAIAAYGIAKRLT